MALFLHLSTKRRIIVEKGFTYGHLWSHILYQQQPTISLKFVKSSKEDWTVWPKLFLQKSWKMFCAVASIRPLA